jgi:hypothetical protein
LITEGEHNLNELTVLKDYNEGKLEELRNEIEAKDKERKAKEGKSALK